MALQLRFTFRDMAQSGCASAQDLQMAWPTFSGNTRPYISFENDTTACPFWRDVQDGLMIPHVDFETDDRFVSAGISSMDDELGSTTTFVDTSVTVSKVIPFVGNELAYFDDSGIPKPQYQCMDNDTTCGSTVDGRDGTRAVSSATSFHTWYIDDERFNKRVTASLVLTPQLRPNSTDVIQVYSSTAFYPLDQFERCNTTSDGRVDCSNGGKTWPASGRHAPIPYADCNPLNEITNTSRWCTRRTNGGCSCSEQTPTLPHNWLFTSALHTFFLHVGGDFTFQGDDDVWVFINGKKAIDMGGLHPAARATVNLSNPNITNRLGLEFGKIYSLDMFHAERHSPSSNFRIETTLVNPCVAISIDDIPDTGKTRIVASYPTNTGIIGAASTSVIGFSEPWAINYVNDGVPGILIVPGITDMSNAAWSTSRVNVDAGFKATIEFEFDPQSPPEGFAMVLHRDVRFENQGLVPGGTGGQLGIPRGLGPSLIIAIDFCSAGMIRQPTTRWVNNNRPWFEIRIHGGSGDDATTGFYGGPWSRRVQVFLDQVLDRVLAKHTIQVVQYGTHPSWMEVYVDGDLYMQHRDLDSRQVLGDASKPTFVGLTSSTGDAQTNGYLRIVDFTLESVVFSPQHTDLLGWWFNGTAISPTINITNDQDTIAFRLQTKDDCGNLAFVMNEDLLGGGNTRLSSPSHDMTPIRIDALGNATYDLVFGNPNKLVNLTFTMLVIALNDGTQREISVPCDIMIDYQRGPKPQPNLVPPDPISSELTVPIDIRPLAGGAAVVVFCLLVVCGIGIKCWRDKWRADKKFIDAGKLATLEKDCVMEGDKVIDTMTRALQRQLEELNWWRSRTEVDYEQVVAEMNRQIVMIKGEIQRLKENAYCEMALV